MKKIKQTLLFLTMLAFVQGCAENASDKAINGHGLFGRKLIGREKALTIAREYLLGKGKIFSEGDHKTFSYKEDQAWDRFHNFPTDEVTDKILQLRREKRKFWLFWFCPLKQKYHPLFTEGTIVVVDRITGEVLYEGEAFDTFAL